MFISFLIKLTELVSLIFTVSYLFALLWVILCEIVEDMILNVRFKNPEVAAEYPDQFFTYYNLDSYPKPIIFLKVFYFAFTSLTTVGFGDFHPCSQYEQMFAAFMILFGVMVFSYIMGEYIELLEGYKEHHKEFDEGDGLRMFLGVLKHFNSN